MIYSTHLTQVLNRLKVSYAAAFAHLLYSMVVQFLQEANLFLKHDLMVPTETEMSTSKLGWRRLRVLREFQSTKA
jgi:hypothetical protein